MGDGYDGGDSYDEGDSYDGGEVTDNETSSESAEEASAFEEDAKSEVSPSVETADISKAEGKGSVSTIEGEETTAFEGKSGSKNEAGKEVSGAKTTEVTKEMSEKVDYSRPTHWRAGMRDEVWENAKDEHGRVRDPVTGRYMSKDQAWDMGHKPGYEFHKHQESARERGISREEFLNEYFNPDHYRPELPSSNRSHKGEDVTDEYFGD